MMRMTVARVGNTYTGDSHYPADAEWSSPWDCRPRADIDAEENTTLRAVITEALLTLSGAEAQDYVPYSVAFWRPEDELDQIGGSSFVLPVRRDDGSAEWRPWSEVKVAELFDAHQHGLIPGDPRRAYAFVLPQVGNGTLPTWGELLHMLEVLRTVAEILALPGGVAATWALLRGLPDQAVDAVSTHASDWGERGLDPYALDQYLDDHPWHPADLAAALACSEDSACAVLWALGFARARSGVWRREVDAESTTMSRIRRLLISTAAPDADDPRLGEELQRRLQHLLDTSEAPAERDWDQLPWLRPALPGNSASQARTRAGFLGRLRQLGKRAD